MSALRDRMQVAIDSGAIESFQLQGVLLYRHLQERLVDVQEGWTFAYELPMYFLIEQLIELEVVNSVELDEEESDGFEENIFWISFKSPSMRAALSYAASQPDDNRISIVSQIEDYLDRFMALAYINNIRSSSDGYEVMFSDFSGTFQGGIQKLDCFIMVKAYSIIYALDKYVLKILNPSFPPA